MKAAKIENEHTVSAEDEVFMVLIRLNKVRLEIEFHSRQ
jgi:hypothetical protein